jgi:hypothetical protein
MRMNDVELGLTNESIGLASAEFWVFSNARIAVVTGGLQI